MRDLIRCSRQVKSGVTAVALALALALALAPGAFASTKCAPPGTSGIDQYFETVPGASCNQSPHGNGGGPGSGRHHGGVGGGSSTGTGGGTGSGHGAGGGSSSGQGTPLSSSIRRQLSAQGAAGQAVARLVGSSGSPQAKSGDSGHQQPDGGGPSAGGRQTQSEGTGRGFLGGFVHPLVSGSTPGGEGLLLPLFFVMAAVLGFVAWIARRRRTGS